MDPLHSARLLDHEMYVFPHSIKLRICVKGHSCITIPKTSVNANFWLSI